MTLSYVNDKVYKHGQIVAVGNAKTGEFSVIFVCFMVITQSTAENYQTSLWGNMHYTEYSNSS